MPTLPLVANNCSPHIGEIELVAQRQAQSQGDAGYKIVVLRSRCGQVRDANRAKAGIEVIGVLSSHILEEVLNISSPLSLPSLSDPATPRRLSIESRDAAVKSFEWLENFRALEVTYAEILADFSPAS